MPGRANGIAHVMQAIEERDQVEVAFLVTSGIGHLEARVVATFAAAAAGRLYRGAVFTV